ncbi:hypothetical protein [Candidatus Nitrotoga sp. 1052]|uniref:hypothetical protein n=1 Tax=Candidatus Nitrotoga sp. 1052 TaxID=2886964 RepID=UPI001EF718BE|nr:hypothetical protein [Candidatus Nitrotoga sp. 1052]CAH1093018.1 conserved exported hypothetical protein [Candidatus Nitrotoga sp. 1052]
MNKIIINFAVVSCFALGATFAHAANDNGSTKSFNYYKAFDPHGVSQAGPGGAQGVIHPKHPIDSIDSATETGYADPNAPTPKPQEMTHPGHRKVDGA